MTFDAETIVPPGAKIKVIGVGGGGGNAVNTMIKSSLEGVDFVACNTDIQSLRFSLAPHKVQVGKELTKGLGAGADPDVGREAAIEDRHEIQEFLAGADMVFITAGMGGGTGTGGASVVAQIARELGALTVAVVTKPFQFEGKRRRKHAEIGIARLRECVDTLITIPNQRLLEVADAKLSMVDAFKMADEVLVGAVRGISDIINIPGIVNVDFADVKTVMSCMGQALMGTGISEGEGRAVAAAKQAISSPLLEDVDIEGATGILINISAGEDITLMEVNEACSVIQEAAHEEANIIFGSVIDEGLEEQIRVTVIATGFPVDDETSDDISGLAQNQPVLGQPLPNRLTSPIHSGLTGNAKGSAAAHSSHGSLSHKPLTSGNSRPYPKQPSLSHGKTGSSEFTSQRLTDTRHQTSKATTTTEFTEKGTSARREPAENFAKPPTPSSTVRQGERNGAAPISADTPSGNLHRDTSSENRQHVGIHEEHELPQHASIASEIATETMQSEISETEELAKWTLAPEHPLKDGEERGEPQNFDGHMAVEQVENSLKEPQFTPEFESEVSHDLSGNLSGELSHEMTIDPSVSPGTSRPEPSFEFKAENPHDLNEISARGDQHSIDDQQSMQAQSSSFVEPEAASSRLRSASEIAADKTPVAPGVAHTKGDDDAKMDFGVDRIEGARAIEEFELEDDFAQDPHTSDSFQSDSPLETSTSSKTDPMPENMSLYQGESHESRESDSPTPSAYPTQQMSDLVFENRDTSTQEEMPLAHGNVSQHHGLMSESRGMEGPVADAPTPGVDAPLDALFGAKERDVATDIDRKIDEALELAERMRGSESSGEDGESMDGDDLDIPAFLRQGVKDLPIN